MTGFVKKIYYNMRRRVLRRLLIYCKIGFIFFIFGRKCYYES